MIGKVTCSTNQLVSVHVGCRRLGHCRRPLQTACPRALDTGKVHEYTSVFEVKGLISEMISKLEKEAEAEATHHDGNPTFLPSAPALKSIGPLKQHRQLKGTRRSSQSAGSVLVHAL